MKWWEDYIGIMLITAAMFLFWIKAMFFDTAKREESTSSSHQFEPLVLEKNEFLFSSDYPAIRRTKTIKPKLCSTRSSSATLVPNLATPTHSSHRSSYPSGLRYTNTLRIGPRLFRDKSCCR